MLSVSMGRVAQHRQGGSEDLRPSLGRKSGQYCCEAQVSCKGFLCREVNSLSSNRRMTAVTGVGVCCDTDPTPLSVFQAPIQCITRPTTDFPNASTTLYRDLAGFRGRTGLHSDFFNWRRVLRCVMAPSWA